MIYLEKIKIIGNSHPGAHVLKKNFEIACSDVNIFVGDQGCGKSTLLTMLQKNYKDISIELSDYTQNHGVKSFYFDTEHDNPRVKDARMYSTPGGQDIGIGVAGAIVSHFQSHGEVMESFILDPMRKAKDCVVILDEPESGLSITNQFKLIKTINGAVKNGCQMFIATHCYPLIEMFNVISLQHNELMQGTEFIKRVREDATK